MSYLFLANASLEITPAAGVAKSFDVKVRYYKVVPKRAPNGLLTVDGGNATEFRLTRGAGLGSIPRSYVYFVYGERTAYAELTDEAYGMILGSTVKVTTIKAPAADPATAAPTEVGEEAPATEPAVPATRSKGRGKGKDKVQAST